MEIKHNFSNCKKNILAYNLVKANRYDKESEVIRGNRKGHKIILLNILNYIKTDQKVFIDLGCGTGDLTKVFFEVFPNITGYLIDGSEEMLSKSKERFQDIKNNIIFKLVRLEHLEWNTFKKKPDLVFSSFAIHHLENIQKWELYEKIYQNLTTNGIFILFDYFQPSDKRSAKLLEFIACMDIKKRTEIKLRKEVDIEVIIKNDREAKKSEGDKEGSLEEHFQKFIEIGFKSVTLIFQEARLAGIIAFKN